MIGEDRGGMVLKEEGIIGVVAGEDDGIAVVAQFADEIGDGQAVAEIQGEGGFVHHDDLRVLQ